MGGDCPFDCHSDLLRHERDNSVQYQQLICGWIGGMCTQKGRLWDFRTDHNSCIDNF